MRRASWRSGYRTYAWLTNHERWIDGTGEKHTYFVKIIAACSDWDVISGNWVDAEGTIVGPVIWGDFAIIQELLDGEMVVKSEADCGLGNLENPEALALIEETILE